MSIPRYPKYQHSNVDWLGSFPAHWNLSYLKYAVDEFFSGGTPDSGNAEYWSDNPVESINWVSIGDMTRSMRVKETEKHITKLGLDSKRLRILPSGTLLYSMYASLGKVAILETASTINQAILGIRPNREKLNRNFLRFWLNNVEAHLALFSSSNTQDNLNAGKVRSLPILLPPVREQEDIANYLEREVDEIDELISRQRHMIDLLSEKSQAVISHSILNGLNTKVQRRSSGVEWLGDIPAHWNITPLKWLTDPNRPIMYGIVLPGPDVGEGIPVLKGGNVRPSKMNLESMARTTPEIEAPFARARLKKGDLVYSIRGSLGDCEIVPTELEGSNITQDVARVAIAAGVCHRWARWALLASAVREELVSGSLGAAVQGINIYDLKRVRIPTPPHDEQEAIATFIEADTARHERLFADAHRAIDLFLERRAALISAAVSGQIDVRGDCRKHAA